MDGIDDAPALQFQPGVASPWPFPTVIASPWRARCTINKSHSVSERTLIKVAFFAFRSEPGLFLESAFNVLR